MSHYSISIKRRKKALKSSEHTAHRTYIKLATRCCNYVVYFSLQMLPETYFSVVFNCNRRNALTCDIILCYVSFFLCFFLSDTNAPFQAGSLLWVCGGGERLPPCKSSTDSFMTVKVRRCGDGGGEKVRIHFSRYRCQEEMKEMCSLLFTFNEKCAGDAGK